MLPKQQVVPKDAAAVLPISDEQKGFADREPELTSMIQDLIGALRQDMVPGSVQEELFDAMNPAVKRQLLAKNSGLDSSVLNTFKDQLNLVDAVLRRTFNDDGSVKGGEEANLAMSPKDILNLSFKVSQMMVKDLPKVYSMHRIQMQEAAIYEVLETHMNREQQDAFIDALSKRQAKL
jgi:hypothetical protein